ncbi:ketopantoate reductase family protein [Persephonella sp.]
MKVVIYGLGAVGTVFAGFLKKSGHTVYAVTKEKYIDKFKNNLITINGIWGDFKTNLDGIFTNTDHLKDKEIDLIILSVKSYDTKNILQDIGKILSKNTFVLIAQNGYGNYEQLTEKFGSNQILLSRIIFGAKIIKTGMVEVTVSADDVKIGDPSGKIDKSKIKYIVEQINNSGIPASFDPNVYQTLWDKILYNCALNPLGALLKSNYGDLASNPETVKIMNNIIKEIFTVCEKNNIKLNYSNSDEYIEYFYRKLIPPTSAHYPSMYYDLLEGKKLEIDALNGAIVQLAKRVGIKVPVNETITNLIKFEEKKNIK